MCRLKITNMYACTCTPSCQGVAYPRKVRGQLFPHSDANNADSNVPLETPRSNYGSRDTDETQPKLNCKTNTEEKKPRHRLINHASPVLSF